MNLLEELRQTPIIAIMRGITGTAADHTADALQQGGVRFLEVTMNTEGALLMIERWRAAYSSKMRIGAGTVLNVGEAEKAHKAGAEYLVCPHLDEGIIDYAKSQGIGVFPGAMTPTEIVRAYAAGADAVKVFPAASLGLPYIQELQGPLSSIPMIPTGGVTLDNVHRYFEAGAAAVGIGGSLADKKLIGAGDYESIRNRAAAFVHRVVNQ